MALSDLSVVNDLLIEMRRQRLTLTERRGVLQGRTRSIQEVVQRLYTTVPHRSMTGSPGTVPLPENRTLVTVDTIYGATQFTEFLAHPDPTTRGR